MKADLVVRNISRLVTCDASLGDGPLGVIPRGAVLAREGRVVWVGPEAYLPKTDAKEVDASGAAVLPGLVDPHTHLVWDGDRTEEFSARARGEAYAARGVMTTVAATREASTDELTAVAMARLDRFAAFGVTLVEAKSGYGLDPKSEARLIDIAADLDHPVVQVVPTYLGAHVIPDDETEEHATQGAIAGLAYAKGKAKFVDAWCDEQAFSASSCEKVLRAGMEIGLRPKLHADQLSRSQGAQLAAKLGCVSADHLEHANVDDARALANAGVVAVLMPGASMMTNQPFADARMFIEQGVKVALSTDFNPGSSYSENLPLQVSLAVSMLKMTVEEAILGVTVHAAAALDMHPDHGSLAPGSVANLVVLEANHEAELAYHYGASLISRVISAKRTP